MARAIVWVHKVPGIDRINPSVLSMSCVWMDFDFLRRWLVGAEKVSDDLYEFRVNGITYRARMSKNMKKWERKYYKDAPESCISELRYIFP